MKKGILGLLVILMVCSCVERRREGDDTSGMKKESRVKADVLS